MYCLRIGTSICTVNLKSYIAKVAHSIIGQLRDDLNWHLLGVEKFHATPTKQVGSWKSLEVLFKIPDEHPHPFHLGVPPCLSMQVEITLELNC